MLDANRNALTTSGYVTELLYELLDAHVDTMRMARELDVPCTVVAPETARTRAERGRLRHGGDDRARAVLARERIGVEAGLGQPLDVGHLLEELVGCFEESDPRVR